MRNVVLSSCVEVSSADEEDAVCVCYDSSGDRVFFVSSSLRVSGRSLRSASWSLAPIALLASSSSSSSADTPVALAVLADSDALCVALRSGDIVLVPLASGAGPPECVGAVDSGALAMHWSPDGEYVVFATGNATLFCLSRSWLPLAEVPIRNGNEGAPTSFTLSFEQDGARFVTHTHFADGTSHMAFWSRDCTLLSTCEPPPKDAQRSRAVAFRPSGFLAAASLVGDQDTEAQVVLYESNGLAHGGFPLRCGRALATDLCWNSDSSLLALVCDGRLQIWRSSNYVWHLAWELAALANGGEFLLIGWSQLMPGRLVVSEGRRKRLRVFDFVRSLSCSSVCSHAVDDQAVVCVVDGRAVRVTGMQRAVVPPPMSESSVEVPFVPAEVAVAKGYLAALGPSGAWCAVRLHAETRQPQSVSSGTCPSSSLPWMQIAWLDESSFVALAASGDVVRVDAASGKVLACGRLKRDAPTPLSLRLYGNVDAQMMLLGEGPTIYRVRFDQDVLFENLFSFPEVCVELASTFDGKLIVGRSHRFKLFAVSLAEGASASARTAVVVEPECTSFALHSRFLVFTTLSSHLRFAPLLESSVIGRVEASYDRQTETGGLLITCLPRGCRTVVQAPRGSLETVYPRPLVALSADRLIDAKQYGSALELLRKHKIDLSLLASRPLDIVTLVSQVKDSDRLCLLLTQVGEGALAAPIINDLCSRVREALVQRPAEEEEKWLPALLTSWVQQKPPQIQEALACVASLRAKYALVAPVFSARNPRSGKNAGERALDYLTFLVPVDQLFDEALGMYDFDLVTAVAKKGQKDPQEYLPFLESLRRLSPARMRYTVDARLQRWSKALASLAEEEGALAECLKLVQEKRLFAFALQSVWTTTPDGKSAAARAECWNLYGNYLENKGHIAEAAICFARGASKQREMACAEQLGDWAWAIASTPPPGPPSLTRVTDLLESQHRWDELARLRIFSVTPHGFAISPESVADALARASHFSEALLWDFDVAKTVILKLANEKASLLRGNATRMKQLLDRLVKLREARKAFEEARAAEQDDALLVENPSEYSQMSVASSRASSSASSTSSLATLAQGRAAQQSRVNKKGAGKSSSSQQGRRLTGKPGSMHEEEWLHRELRALVPDEAALRACHNLLLATMRCEGDVEARALQMAQSALVEESEAAFAEMMIPCVLHGRGGVSYLQYWTPPGHLHVQVAPEHVLSPAIDQTVLKPPSAVSTAFKWKLVLLE